MGGMESGKMERRKSVLVLSVDEARGISGKIQHSVKTHIYNQIISGKREFAQTKKAVHTKTIEV